MIRNYGLFSTTNECLRNLILGSTLVWANAPISKASPQTLSIHKRVHNPSHRNSMTPKLSLIAYCLVIDRKVSNRPTINRSRSKQLINQSRSRVQKIRSETNSPQSRKSNPESKIQNPKFRIQKIKYKINNPKSKIQNPENHIQN